MTTTDTRGVRPIAGGVAVRWASAFMDRITAARQR
jgi:hypothetical protein